VRAVLVRLELHDVQTQGDVQQVVDQLSAIEGPVASTLLFGELTIVVSGIVLCEANIQS